MIDDIKTEAEVRMKKSLDALGHAFNKIRTGRANPNILPFSPTSYYPTPTQTEINNGEFVRYFLRKSNENLYIEVNSGTLSASSNSSLYISFQLPWVISGDKEFVRKANAKQIAFTEKKQNIVGLGVFLNFDYLQFYQG